MNVLTNQKPIIFWQIFGSILYHTLLITHLSVLFYIMPRELYGLMGILFSLLYTAIMLVNAGFDEAIASLYRDNQNRSLHAIPGKTQKATIVLFFLIVIVGFFFNVVFFQSKIDLVLIAILSTTLWLESRKKIYKSMLTLLKKTRSVAIGELGMICLYIIFIWTGYLYFKHFSLHFVFLSLSACSYIEYYYFLSQIPQDTIDCKQLSSLKWQQLAIYIVQIVQQISSVNVLIPAIAFFYGLSLAAEAKLVSSIIINGAIIIQQVVASLSMIFFAHESKRTTNRLLVYINRATTISCLFLFMIGLSLWLFVSDYPRINTLIVMIIGASSCIETLLIAYKKWYISEQKSGLMVIFLAISIFFGLLAWGMQKTMTGIAFFGLIVASRCCYLLILLLYSGLKISRNKQIL